VSCSPRPAIASPPYNNSRNVGEIAANSRCDHRIATPLRSASTNNTLPRHAVASDAEKCGMNVASRSPRRSPVIAAPTSINLGPTGIASQAAFARRIPLRNASLACLVNIPKATPIAVVAVI